MNMVAGSRGAGGNGEQGDSLEVSESGVLMWRKHHTDPCLPFPRVPRARCGSFGFGCGLAALSARLLRQHSSLRQAELHADSALSPLELAAREIVSRNQL